jgi:four helix bundle protein
MNFPDWSNAVPEEITSDPLWRMMVYRQALFLGDIAWLDVCKLAQDRRMIALSDQLYRAVGSISANIAEGYSKESHKDQARFYEYALGSARETRDWYYKARYVLEGEISKHRMQLTVEIIHQLLKMVPAYRDHKIGEG